MFTNPTLRGNISMFPTNGPVRIQNGLYVLGKIEGTSIETNNLLVQNNTSINLTYNSLNIGDIIKKNYKVTVNAGNTGNVQIFAHNWTGSETMYTYEIYAKGQSVAYWTGYAYTDTNNITAINPGLVPSSFTVGPSLSIQGIQLIMTVPVYNEFMTWNILETYIQ